MTTTSATGTGTVVTTGSTTYISSTASGLDTSSLISAAVATMTAPVTTIDAQISTNQNKISAYSDVQILLSDLSSSIDALTSSTNLSTGTTSAFANTEATVSSSDASVAASSILSASSDSSATDGSYTLTVSQLATSMKVASSTMSDTTALGETGSFTIAAADGTAATINVTSDMTLSDIASAISAQSAATGVNATLVQVSSGQYTLVLSSADTGQAITATATSGDDVLTDIGVTSSSGGGFANVLQQAQDAVITLDGTTITRSSNTLDDVLPGVTLNLDGTTAAGDTVTLNIASDTSGVTSAVESFISAYNNLHDFLETQESETDGTVSSTAYLFADTTIRSLTSELDTLISGASASGSAGGASDAISYLSQLGITLDSSNDLELSDPTALSDALSANPDALQSFFQTSYSTSNSALTLMDNTSTVSQSFTLDIAADSSGVTGVTVDGQSGLFTVSGDEIIGAAGTAYAGLTFAISATSDQSISVNLQQGFADSVVSLASQYGDSSTGLLENQISSLTSVDTDLANQAATIESNASSYETTLISKYATMETEISAAQILQKEIDAVLNGSSSSS
jgi:flagellar hook-associated protein 2